ncbi:MAG: TetR/AcrR family transcriptional regulator [Desulfobacterales bacterium]|nr:TetR/AcrR family transcriptional regulator [Desulfobacterales bacterium]
MPPKFKFTKAEILDTAFKLVREKGWVALSTRSLANALGSSARPIYSYFNSMDELEVEIVKKGVDLLYGYMTQERIGDPWHDHGIGYVMFAQNEKCLFRALNDEKHIKYFKEFGEVIWNTLTNSLSGYQPFQGLSEEEIYKVQALRWLLAHGLAFQVSNPPPGVWDDEKVFFVMQQGSTAILEGLKLQFD